MAKVQLRNVCKNFGGVEAIRSVSLDIEDRELAVCVGPSGCGKSTLLRLVAGLEDASSGEILIDGETVNRVPAAKRGVAMVFQSYALYPHMTVLENMSFSLRLAGVARKEREEKAREAARVLQIESLLERKPRELSGGQRQRVAIGRAMVRNPRVFLFDEPLSNLDAALRAQMRLEIMRLHERLGSTMIYVTHDQVEAMTMADRIIVLQGGEVEQAGTPLELYRHPCNSFVAGFIGSPRMNFIPAVVIRTAESGALVTLPGGLALEVRVAPGAVRPNERVSLGVRPEDLIPADGGRLAGQIAVLERLGSKTILHVQTDEGPMLAVEAAGGYPARVHDPVRLELNREAIHLFNEAGDAIPAGPGRAERPA